jgi:hypothetical protein
MKVLIQFPPQGIDVTVKGVTADGKQVDLVGLEVVPDFFLPHAAVPIMYGRVEADLPGRPNTESHKFSLVVTGAAGQVRMVHRVKPVKSRYEETGELPPRQKKTVKPSEKSQP